MSHPRATAQQAIEVLKVYKLRKENAVILEEIKRLRGEVIGRQHDLSNALRQVADLQTQISDVVHNAREHDTKLETLEVARNSANDSIRGLRQEYEQARHDLTHKIEGQQAAIEKNHAATEKLRGENGHFRKQIEDSDNRIANIVDDMSQDLNAKAEQQDVIEFNARLNQLIQDLDLRLKAHESVSRVTDTAEQRIDLTLGERFSHTMTRTDGKKIQLCQVTSSTMTACGSPSALRIRQRQSFSQKITAEQKTQSIYASKLNPQKLQHFLSQSVCRET